jgi:5,10-methylene-tetrahydrofolate dehydrogenase/methenyl tetrahydrofolate cyclohydrolase
MRIINGLEASKKIIIALKKEVELMDIKPGLGIILVGNRKDSQTYINMKKRKCNEVEILNHDVFLPENISESELLIELDKLNNNPQIHGILIQLPLPSHINLLTIFKNIKIEKDIEGFHPQNMGNLVLNNYYDYCLPCTPKGCIELLDLYNIELKGKNVVVIGKSNVVGLPLSLLLLNREATVSICHVYTEKLKMYTLLADILIVACGKAHLIDKSHIKEGAIILDIGINHIEDKTSKKGYKIVGDVNFEDVKDKVSMITPVPGGIGPMTIAMLLKNTVMAAKSSKS